MTATIAMRAILVFGLVLIVAPVSAHYVNGAGARSCADFAQAYKNNPGLTEEIFYSWAFGFMSGLNATTGETY
jgi:hypothetical protein